MKDKDEIKEAMIKDLELQWKDHFHMRDQTWKTLSNSILVFLGIVGLEIKNVGNIVMLPAYCVLIFISFIGWAVAAHHRVRQEQKFLYITKYEEELGLLDLKEDIIKKVDSKTGLSGKIFTARFIEITHLGIILIALFLLIKRIFFE